MCEIIILHPKHHVKENLTTSILIGKVLYNNRKKIILKNAIRLALSELIFAKFWKSVWAIINTV